MLELAGGRPNILELVESMKIEDVQQAGSRKASVAKKVDGSDVTVKNT